MNMVYLTIYFFNFSQQCFAIFGVKAYGLIKFIHSTSMDFMYYKMALVSKFNVLIGHC